MRRTTAPGDLVMRWVEVVDEAGRSRMEARWSVVPETDAPAQAPTPVVTHVVAA